MAAPASLDGPWLLLFDIVDRLAALLSVTRQAPLVFGIHSLVLMPKVCVVVRADLRLRHGVSDHGATMQPPAAGHGLHRSISSWVDRRGRTHSRFDRRPQHAPFLCGLCASAVDLSPLGMGSIVQNSHNASAPLFTRAKARPPAMRKVVFAIRFVEPHAAGSAVAGRHLSRLAWGSSLGSRCSLGNGGRRFDPNTGGSMARPSRRRPSRAGGEKIHRGTKNGLDLLPEPN